MSRVLLAAALACGACWTGSDTPVVESTVAARPSQPERPKLRVKLERTGCFGNCPAYSVVIDGSGRVEWIGHANVLAMGRRQGSVTRFELDELSRRIDRARFFERDGYGELPQQKQECQTVGTTTTCTFSTSVSICSDTSHAIISVQRGVRRHKLDNDHCTDRPELDALEEYIDRIANTEAWIEQ
jgi:hypothetical protein